MRKYDVVILGGGPAGLTAAVYGRRAGLSALILEKEGHGGQIKLTHAVENWPGTPSINGYELGTAFHEHALALGAEFEIAPVTGLEIRGGQRYVSTETEEIEAGAVIVATGATFRHLEIPGEAEYTGNGVSCCAVCDAPFYRNQEVAVVGGGNTALQEAEYLTAFVSKVHLVHRRGEFRADGKLVEKVLANEKIITHLHQVPLSIGGDGSGVTGLRLKDVRTDLESELPVTGVFVFVGTIPHSAFAKGFLNLTPEGAIITDAALATNQPGIFAAGDVRDTDLRQVITAAADGARAAMNAYHFIKQV